MGSDYKRFQFAEILNEGIEDENQRLRQQLGGLQEKFEQTERVHQTLRDHLEAVQKHNRTLDKTNVAAFALVDQLGSNYRHMKAHTIRGQDKEWPIEMNDFGAEHRFAGVSTQEVTGSFRDMTPATGETGNMPIYGHNQNERRHRPSSGKRLWTTI